MVLQHSQKQYCCKHWFNNISKHNVATATGVTTFPNIMLLKPLVSKQVRNSCGYKYGFYNMFKHKFAKHIGFATLQTLKLHSTVDMSKIHAAENIGCTTFHKQELLTYLTVDLFEQMLLKPIVLATVFL